MTRSPRLRRVASGLPRALNTAATAALIAAAAAGKGLVAMPAPRKPPLNSLATEHP